MSVTTRAPNFKIEKFLIEKTLRAKIEDELMKPILAEFEKRARKLIKQQVSRLSATECNLLHDSMSMRSRFMVELHLDDPWD